MFRIILFLVLIGFAAFGAAWVADQTGDIVLSWSDWRIATTLPVFALALSVTVVAAILVWAMIRALWRMPERLRRRRREKLQARGRHAITHGLLAIGHGDSQAARAHAAIARRHAEHDPLALLLHAQSAQLDGDRAGAQRAFRAMAERKDTRLLGLRGLFVEAQRADDSAAAATIAEEALKLAPGSTWASQAVLGFRCAKADWNGALTILDNNLASGLIDKAVWKRQRGVLLTARALELENTDRDLSRDSITEAIKLAPTLVPAAVLASKYQSEAHQIRRSIRIVETAWLAHPHPDLADAYAHVKLGDSARQRLVRIETLAAKTPGHPEGLLAIARAAIDATEFARAREALAPLISNPTQRVAMLMAEIERSEHGDSGKARAWTLRAVRAMHDPVWTADGYVSDRWRPVSPVTGRLDAFQWQMPLASLPSDKDTTIESAAFNEEISAPRRVAPPREMPQETNSPAQDISQGSDQYPSQNNPQDNVQDNSPALAPAALSSEVLSSDPVSSDLDMGSDLELPAATPAAELPARPAAVEPSAPIAATPLFRSRQDIPAAKAASSPIPAVIPLIRAPDDPGIDEDGYRDEFAEQINPTKGQTGGWRGFLTRWGS